ncbi:TlyA family RNA methyltransferase [Aquamicrobium sp. LC103]|uniref:TlyA family RNA methyltransferase n=1 Tax=Aquamicrobium sp. LC103 TaxID=1120658 RepID=UPI00063E7209|nr:TlyA family RNA methyltransferase [Aquamicrobium sp. LC103]TKT81138.1 TlyA family RNA methyltransferase [Aquamicrobium sp. LC103]
MNAETHRNEKLRLDEALVARGLAPSRSRARDAILRGTVSVDSRIVAKPGYAVAADAPIAIADPAGAYVSRAALKLVHALDAFGLDPKGANALDIGASTGGFTQVLLERGAGRVTAIDVGHGQFDGALAADPRVTSLEKLNARDLTAVHLDGIVPDFLVSDVSFISMKLALPPALDLAAPGARGVFLVKPQFEAGREAIGKGGILRDPGEAERIASSLRDWLDTFPGWRATGLVPSPIEGGDGNREYLLAGVKDR